MSKETISLIGLDGRSLSEESDDAKHRQIVATVLNWLIDKMDVACLIGFANPRKILDGHFF